MDPFLVLSFVLSMVAIAISIITLWLTAIRGPDISLLNEPEFEVSDETFNEQQIQEDTPKWFSLKQTPFVFANHGGKTGTILELNLTFAPNNSFQDFFERFDTNIARVEGDLYPPFTIGKGDNKCLNISPDIVTINWKETSLVEVLEFLLHPKISVILSSP